MSVTISIDAKKLVEAFRRIPNIAASNCRLAMREGLREVQTQARADHAFTPRSGRLERSIQSQSNQLGLSGKVFLNTGVAPYGVYQHEGTKEHYVAPVRAKALHWVVNGKNFFSKGHRVKGIKKDQFLYRAAANKQDALFDRIFAAIRKTIKEAGL